MVNAAAVASFGMGLIVIRDVARDPSKAGKYWAAMLYMQTVLALIAYVAMNGVAIGYSDTVRAFVALAGINLFVDLFGNMSHDLLLAREDMVLTSAGRNRPHRLPHRARPAGADRRLGAARRLWRGAYFRSGAVGCID